MSGNYSGKISVVMATLNEERAVKKVITDIRKYGGNLVHEIIVVDSSTDNTATIARQLGARVFTQPRQGAGKALLFGMQQAVCDAVLVTDCDDTYPMEDIPQFVAWWQRGYDLVNGNRMRHVTTGTMPRQNIWANKMFALIVRVLFNIPTHDIASGLRLYSQRLLRSSHWETNLSFWIEIMIKAKKGGFTIKEIPIVYRTRIGNVTLNPWRSGRAYLLCILKYRFGLNFIPTKLL